MHFSEKLILNQGDTSLKKDFNSLLIKIRATLRNFEKDNIAKLENRVASSHTREVFTSDSLSIIQKAITNNIVVQIKYHSFYKNEITQRAIEPLGIYFTEKAWVVVAFCKLRDEIREFRLDRVLEISFTSQTFDYKDEFILSNYFSKLIDPS